MLLGPQAWAAPGADGQACVPFADKVLAWDAQADLYVVATYYERERPPAGGKVFPNLLELRRLSTGGQLALANCAETPGRVGAAAATSPCDFRTAFGRHVPATVTFRRQGTALDRSRVAIKMFPEGPVRSYALMARTPATTAQSSGLHRVLWLEEHILRPGQRANLRITDGERWQNDVLLVLESSQQGGTCNFTETRMLRMAQADLEKPAALEHQARLLTRLKQASPYAAWRSAADIAPLPPKQLLWGMVAAAEAGKPEVATRWWHETTAAIPLDQLAPLAAALRDWPELTEVRERIRLPEP